jgi:hypothetical protein
MEAAGVELPGGIENRQVADSVKTPECSKSLESPLEFT